MNWSLIFCVSLILGAVVMYKVHSLEQESKDEVYSDRNSRGGILQRNIYLRTLKAAGFILGYSVSTFIIYMTILLNIAILGPFLNMVSTGDYGLAIVELFCEFCFLFMIYLALLGLRFLPKNIWNFDDWFQGLIDNKVESDIERCRMELNKDEHVMRRKY